MIAMRLLAQWGASRKHYSPRECLSIVMRSLRVWRMPRLHRAWCALDTQQRLLRHGRACDFFHHLSHRHYLRQGLTLAQRSTLALAHGQIESTCFDEAYKTAIYEGPGLLLWQHPSEEGPFEIRLSLACRRAPEGELYLSLELAGKRLHSIAFNWLSSRHSGMPWAITPFIARNQGRWRSDAGPLQAFERVFPHNSPSYFCYSALQGIARAVGANEVLAVRSLDQLCYDPSDTRHFANAYDGFWQALGGQPVHAMGYRIPVPFLVKPLEEVSAKHRSRARQRRAHWLDIETAVCAAFGPHLRGESEESITAAASAVPATLAPSLG